MNSTPSSPVRIMRLTALPPPPTLMTLMRALVARSSSSRSRRRLVSRASSASCVLCKSPIRRSLVRQVALVADEQTEVILVWAVAGFGHIAARQKVTFEHFLSAGREIDLGDAVL